MGLTKIADDLWIGESRLRTMGLIIPIRMTVARDDDGLWIHSPIALDDCRDHLEALGRPHWRVAPNAMHHLFQRPYENAYPASRLAAPRRLEGKRADLRIDQYLDTAPADLFGASITFRHLPNAPGSETVFLHHPSRSLITTDLAFSMDETFSWPARLYGRLVGINNRFAVARSLRLLYKDKLAARKDMDMVLDMDFVRIVPAHGPTIEDQAKQRLAKAFDWLRA